MKNLECKISKLDEENKIVEGVVYRPSKEFDNNGNPTDHTDSHGDWATVEDVKKASHKFMEKLMNTNAKGVDKQHNEIDGYGYVVENYIAKC
ncbi:MAG: XkdF-like putative serine protease domain-containing protein, partial [Peptostreptococcaceae bacterium]